MKKESKTIRSFLAIDLAEDLKPEIADVQKEFPDYQLQVALDADFEEE